MSEPYDDDPEGMPCVVSDEVSALMMDPDLSGELFGAIVAATVLINETQGEVPGSTASARWPQQRRMPLGADGSLGVAEYVIVADADPAHIVLTRIQFY
ncbi:hypothetical protein ACFY7N_29035 [Streptomyces albidoflavus]|uniref:hypothetical protein n=1 Tax=Streptomyces albidoflavus TaxID=1886 RepID=UPI003456697F